MSFSSFEIFVVFALCMLIKWLIHLDERFLETRGGKIAQSLLNLVGTIGWAALIALIVIWFVKAVSGTSLPDTIGGTNAMIDRPKGWMGYSRIALFLLCAAALVGLLALHDEAAETGARRVGSAIKWTGKIKAAFLLLATCSFVSAERNGSVRVSLAEAQAQRANLMDAQLVLFEKVETALVREAINSALDQELSNSGSLAATSQSYGLAGAYVSPLLGRSLDFGDTFVRPASSDFRPAAQAKAAVVEKAAAPAIEAGSAEKAQKKLVDDLVKIAFGKGTSTIKAAYVDLGHPLLNSVLDAVVDPAFLDPLRDMAARQANRLMRGEIGWRDARDSARRLGRSLAAGVNARLAGLRARSVDAPFGEPEWDHVRTLLDRVAEEGFPGKTPLVQEETRKTMREMRSLRGSIRTLLSATPKRAAAEERAFANILDAHPVYAALWGYGVISFPPSGLEDRLRILSIVGSDEKASQIQNAIVEANLGDSDMRSALIEMGFDPDKDGTLSIPQIKEKLYTGHGAYPRDGFRLYYDIAQPDRVNRAISYFRSDPVKKAVLKYCSVTG
jgi:hypothetical protein